MGLLRFALKSSILSGVTYFTIQEGIWSSPEESGKLYGKIYNTVTPLVKENVPKELVNEIPTIPNLSDLKCTLASSWNYGVKVSIQFLINLPEHASNGIESLKNQIDNAKKSDPSDPPTSPGGKQT